MGAMQYDVYHDESKEGGYWHGILMVPQERRGDLLAGLAAIRKSTGYAEPLMLKGLDRRKSDRFQCVRASIQFGVVTLIQSLKGYDDEHIRIGSPKYVPGEGLKTEYVEPVRVTNAIRARFILFRERDDHHLMDPHKQFMDYGAKVETTFRMGFKGGLHFLFDDEDPALITSLHFDGYEHHSGRHVDGRRIIGRLCGLREYCSFVENLQIDDRSSDHRIDKAQLHDDCQLLQLTDLLVGSFRTVLGTSHNEVQREVALPVQRLVERWNQGQARMRNSRWHQGFCISECHLEGENWIFTPISSTESSGQQALF